MLGRDQPNLVADVRSASFLFRVWFVVLFSRLFTHVCSSHFPAVFVHADLINVFSVFLPQLLLYPNPTDPLNGAAASLLLKDKKTYDAKVRGRCFFLRLRLFLGVV